MIVRYHDLDLGTEHGVRKLNRRIASASRLVCGEPADRSLRESKAVASCRQEADHASEGILANAVRQPRSSERQRVAVAKPRALITR